MTMLPGEVRIATEARRGRGAVSNAAGRYERFQREGVDDGWGESSAPDALRREIAQDRPRRIITRNRSPDIPFDRSINPYRGCEHGCVYCFARPTHAWLGLSPGLDFETKLTVRPGAAELLRRELDDPRYRPAPIALGTNTDPYQPLEKDWRIVREILSVLLERRHPVTIVTKSALVVRDLDLLEPAAAQGLARVALSVTTLDHRLSRRMEPRASAPQRRLWAIGELARAGVPTVVMTAPVIPALTDHEMEAILERARDAGAQAAGYVALRMPLEISTLFREWLAEHYPDRAARVLRLVREMHGGRDYRADWGKRLRGEGVYADLIARRFRSAVARLGLETALPPLRTDLFRRPPSAGEQLSLF